VDKAMLDGRTVDGYSDGDAIVIGLFNARNWSRADSLVVTIIHELLHMHNEAHSEHQVRRWETEFFKSRVMREAVLIRLLNIVLFKEE
jgi:uncharacterized protein YdaT